MQLLVSPSSIDEARHSGAADIIDVKKPSEGSLGANFPWVIREIKAFSKKPVSAAIGDFDYKPGGASLAAYGAACAGADYVKIGLAFEGQEQARDVISAVVKAVKDEFPKKFVVIAAYSDFERMHSISPFDMAPIAAECGADFAMVDTGIKDRQSTFAFMDEADTPLLYREEQKTRARYRTCRGTEVRGYRCTETDQPGYYRCPGHGLRRRP